MFSDGFLNMDAPEFAKQKKTYIHQFCVDTGCCLEDLRDRWQIGTDGER